MGRSTTAWRGAVAVALAGAGVFAATTASAAGEHAGPAAVSPASSSTSYSPCPTAHLRVWRPASKDGTAGSTYWELEFSNVSTAACTLTGYPRVAAVDGSGHQLGSAASHDTRFAPATVVVQPGTTAHAVLRIVDVGVLPAGSCQPARAAGLRVYPPGTTKAAFVPLVFQACSQTGPSFLSVRTVRPRAGIPGYSQ